MKRGIVNQPVFIISLDIELLWGFIHESNKVTGKYISLLAEDRQNARGASDFLLRLFEQHDIPATWAFTGHLLLNRCERKDGVAHKNMPRPREDWYSCDPCSDIHSAPLYYGRDIVQKVLRSPIKHEIGYHSFSHCIFSEISEEVARAEIEAGINLARELGINLNSFVFPQNKIGHLNILKEYEFKIYRGANQRFWNPDQSFLKRKLMGAVDKTIASPSEPIWREGIWEIPSSLLFFDPHFPLTLLPRTKLGLERAIRAKKIFHVFLHLHNLVVQPSLPGVLKKFISFVDKKRQRDELLVTTMEGLASHLNQ